MKSILSLYLVIILFAAGEVLAIAQGSPEIPRIGVLVPWSGPSEVDRKRDRDAFMLRLEELGYFDEKNIRIEWRYANSTAARLYQFAEELVRLKPAVIVASGTTAISVALKVTKSVPIVMVSGGNPVSRGFVKTLPMPGGNVTGLSSTTVGHEGKRLELFRETFPTIMRVVILNADKAKRRAQSYENDGKALGLNIELVHINRPDDLTAALASIVSMRPDALVTVRNLFTIHHADQIVEFALNNRLPAMFEARHFVISGGLMSYGIDYTTSWRRAAVYVDKILKGANPATLPVEPPQLELVVNLKTAKKIGVTIPPEILLEANEVIK
jgi:putative ABC transport system substrate-binding protein